MTATRCYDTIVIGSGLAGLTAAITAASRGLSVCIVTDGPLFSGSSFSKSTWGLGMVTDFSSRDKRASESLFKALCGVGMGMNDPLLSETLVSRSHDALAFLTSVGATILDPQEPGQREFVACFDHQIREWHGFVGNKSTSAFREALTSNGIDVLDHSFTLSLLEGLSGNVCGALVLLPQEGKPTLHNLSTPVILRAKSVILATGGLCGLYGRHLCSPHCVGNGHILALDAGAEVVNLEFVQLMLGTLSPLKGLVFNEKLYRWTQFATREGADVFEMAGFDNKSAGRALEAHSWHGPYTTRLESHVVDETLDTLCREGNPAYARYDDAVLGEDAPEFIRTYFSWMRDERGVDPRQPTEVGMFAHSCNGGIRIGADARTGVPGLLACGECAGGVHGADRIGGLASITATTFGLIAGEQAALMGNVDSHDDPVVACSPLYRTKDVVEDPSLTIAKLLDSSCMVNREGKALKETLSVLQDLEDQISRPEESVDIESALSDESSIQAVKGAASARFKLRAARALALSCLRRDETRGPHHRCDYPTTDAQQEMARPLTNDGLSLHV